MLCKTLASQTTPFKNNTRWGIKQGNEIIVAPVFDTIFNFDETGKVCLACFRQKNPSNKIMKVNSFTYSCNYLNNKQQKLRVKNGGNDTCTVFSLGKNTVKQYNDNPFNFVVSIKGRKHLVDKTFRQLTFNGYDNVVPSLDPSFYLVQEADESETVFSGLIDLNEKVVVPLQYSHIRINPVDSLIIGCTAGVRDGYNDDIFDYSGKKIHSHHRHIEMATKNFMIHKVPEPKEHFVIYNIKTKEEKNLQAGEVHFFERDEILIKIRDDWYVYDLNTNTKKPKQL